MRPQFDERDRAILEARSNAFHQHTTPQVGDFVIFADGTERRISHNWGDEVQTSDDGSFYLGDGYMSFAGSLYTSIPIILEKLSLDTAGFSIMTMPRPIMVCM